MFDTLKRLIGLKKGKKSYETLSSRLRGGYDCILEIRPILERYKLKSLIREVKPFHELKPHRVPHITLVYSFQPRVEDYRIIRTVAHVARNYGVMRFSYDGLEIKRGGKGYVLALRIVPSRELQNFRDDVYKSIKPIIDQRPDAEGYNEDSWLHASLSFRSAENPESVVPSDLLNSINSFLFEAAVMRITLVRRGKIRYEYDALTGEILTREEALSKEKLKTSYSVYRERVLKLNLKRGDLDNVWLTADQHFGHRNIIRYTARPFVDVTEMDELLASRWNELVSNNDDVYVLGDFAFYTPKRYLEKLKGKRKVLIQGNHDPEGIGPESLELGYGKYKFTLSHHPLSTGEWNIHGHIHNNRLREYPFLNQQTKKINVGVDLTKFYPVSLGWITELVESGNSILLLP